MEKKTIRIYNEIKKEISQGKYGNSGDKFISIRELCDSKQISLVSSFRICNMLEDDGLLLLHKSTRYLTFGRIKSDAPLNKILKKSPVLFGIHAKELAHPYVCSVISHMEKELKKRGYMVIISSSENDYNNEKIILTQFINMGCSYVLNFPSVCNNSELNEFYDNYPLPLLFIGRTIPNTKTSSIITDNHGTGVQIANYLFDCGYTSFYFLGLKISKDQNQRFLGFEEGLNRHGITLSQDHYIMLDYNDESAFNSFSLEIKRQVENGQKIGIFCLNDIFAVNILNTLQKKHISVPTQVGIIGYDDLEICRYASPPLTTVSYNYNELAKQAINFILSPKNFGNKKHCIINNQLTIRSSTTKLNK